MPALTCESLEKRYGPTLALGGVDLEVAPGELLGLLGPNGAGKSTLTKIACGLVRATAGHAEVEGAPAGSAQARAAIGYLAELFRFPDWLTAEEVLGLHQDLAGSEGGAGERGELLELVSLGEASATKVGAMSKGMQQRLGIAQALVGSPRLLMLDEPTSALDPVGRRIVRDLLRELRGRRDRGGAEPAPPSEVELVGDRVVILVGGRIVAHGTPAELAATRGGGSRPRPASAPFPRRSAWGCRDVARARGSRRARLRSPAARLDARGRRPRGGRRRVSSVMVVARYALR